MEFEHNNKKYFVDLQETPITVGGKNGKYLGYELLIRSLSDEKVVKESIIRANVDNLELDLKKCIEEFKKEN